MHDTPKGLLFKTSIGIEIYPYETTQNADAYGYCDAIGSNEIMNKRPFEKLFKAFKCKTCKTDFLVEVRQYYNMTKQELSVKCPRCSLVVLNTKFANKIRETYGLENVHEEIIE